MTTSVKVSVPAGANYVAEVSVKASPKGERHVYTVSPGDTFDVYVYAEREISIREVSLSAPQALPAQDADAPRGYRHTGMDHF